MASIILHGASRYYGRRRRTGHLRNERRAYGKYVAGKICLPLAATVSIAVALSGTTPVPNAQRREGAVDVEMRNVMYHFTDQIAVHIRRLDGKLVPKREGAMPVFDDQDSFTLAINSGEISISTANMASVLNKHVFAASDAPLKKISIDIRGTRLRVKGKLHDKGDLPFGTEGTISVTPEGEIRIHAEKIKVLHLPVKGIMDLLGIKIADLINTNEVRGLRADRNDLLLNPEQVLPPPQIESQVTDVQLHGDQIIQTFGKKIESTSRNRQFGNYMAYRGAQLRFGKLTMSDSDLVLIDMDRQDPFDFYLDRYKEQLVAGYTKTTPSFGLRVYMRDFNKLHTPAPGKKAQAAAQQ